MHLEDKNFLTSVTVKKGVIALNLSRLFYNCQYLESADLSGLDTSVVTKFTAMFYNCSNLKTIDISSFDMSNTESINLIFNGTNKLEVIYLPQTLNAVSGNIDLPTNSTYNTNIWVLRNNETIKGTKFSVFGENLSTRLINRAIYIEELPEEYRPYDVYLWYMDYQYQILQQNHEVEGLEEIDHIILLKKYIGLEKDVYVPAVTIIKGVEYTTVFDKKVYYANEVIESISVGEGVIALDLEEFFCYSTSIQTVDLRGLDASRVTSTKWMFSRGDPPISHSSLKTVIMSGLNTSNLISMQLS